MSKIKITVLVEELRGLKAELVSDMDSDPQWLAQFDTRGEAAEDLIESAMRALGERIRAEFDRADKVNAELARLGEEKP